MGKVIYYNLAAILWQYNFVSFAVELHFFLYRQIFTGKKNNEFQKDLYFTRKFCCKINYCSIVFWAREFNLLAKMPFTVEPVWDRI